MLSSRQNNLVLDLDLDISIHTSILDLHRPTTLFNVFTLWTWSFKHVKAAIDHVVLVTVPSFAGGWSCLLWSPRTGFPTDVTNSEFRKRPKIMWRPRTTKAAKSTRFPGLFYMVIELFRRYQCYTLFLWDTGFPMVYNFQYLIFMRPALKMQLF
jgi:hypothetical protein